MASQGRDLPERIGIARKRRQKTAGWTGCGRRLLAGWVTSWPIWRAGKNIAGYTAYHMRITL